MVFQVFDSSEIFSLNKTELGRPPKQSLLSKQETHAGVPTARAPGGARVPLRGCD